METINVTKETKYEFEKELLALRMFSKRNIFADEFVNILIKHWREDKKDLYQYKRSKNSNEVY